MVYILKFEEKKNPKIDLKLHAGVIFRENGKWTT